MNEYAEAPPCGGSRVRDQSGGIITGWLLQLLVLMAVLAFIGHDAIAVAITALNLDNTARDVAEASAQAYARSEDPEEALAAGEPVAAAQGAEITGVEVDGPILVVVVEKRADTWWAHRIPPLEDVITPSATGRRRWQ